MSRSYRKNPIVKEGKRKSKKSGKTAAANTLREKLRKYAAELVQIGVDGMKYALVQYHMDILETRTLPKSNGRHFSLWYDQYTICDIVYYYTMKHALVREAQGGWKKGDFSWRLLSEEEKKEAINKWKKEMYWK